MQVRLIKDCFGPNPNFDKRKPAGLENPREITVPKGTILDDPMAYIHCRGEDPNAEPYDDEAKKNHAEYLAWRANAIKEREAGEDSASEPADEDDISEKPEDGEGQGAGQGITPILPLPDSSAAAATPEPEPDPEPKTSVVDVPKTVLETVPVEVVDAETAPADAAAVVKRRR